jgi:hypothetical protein
MPPKSKSALFAFGPTFSYGNICRRDVQGNYYAKLTFLWNVEGNYIPGILENRDLARDTSADIFVKINLFGF